MGSDNHALINTLATSRRTDLDRRHQRTPSIIQTRRPCVNDLKAIEPGDSWVSISRDWMEPHGSPEKHFATCRTGTKDACVASKHLARSSKQVMTVRLVSHRDQYLRWIRGARL